VTLLFAQSIYERVAEAYIAGLEARRAAGGDISGIASVASFFISRIDSAVDAALTEVARRAGSSSERDAAQTLMGRAAIANAKLTYQRYKQLFSGPRWRALAEAGAQTQRLLWASTSTKNPAYSDVVYVEELIGPDTVDTVPPATFDAFRDHGRAEATLEQDLPAAQQTMSALARVGVDFDTITDRLLIDAVAAFDKAFAALLDAVGQSRTAPPTPHADRITASLPKALAEQVDTVIDDWQRNNKVRRLWARDATLWTGHDEAAWLGWLGIAADQLAHPHELETIAADVRSAGFRQALLLGMGGSSLCPEMLSLTFPRGDGHPQLLILDSTDPAQVAAVAERVDPPDTLFIVSSKSGSTLEPNIFKQYFLDRVSKAIGKENAAAHFIAITDPGSPFENVARTDGYRHIASGVKSIGGRYSALSNFGMVPGAVMGVDVQLLLDRAETMAQACASCVPATQNPGVRLGAVIGVCATHGRDKLTLITSPAIGDLGAWLEQLLAESTGKQGHGVIPVDLEPLGAPDVYGDDRLFAYVRLESAPDPDQDAAVEALERAGHPVVRIRIDDPYDIGGEIFRWEFATAVAGSVIGINPFDQPDVEASKVVTRSLTAEYEKTGSLPPEQPILEEGELRLFTNEANAQALASAKSFDEHIATHLARIRSGDYVGLLAYVDMTPEHRDALQEIRTLIRDRTRAATCVGFGPRFLHSTGQAYKGGPNSGVFLQITCDDAADIPVPGQKYTFGVVKAAQARGDFAVLAERGRRALRVHLGRDVSSGLAALRAAVEKATR
jgi:transaldolase/glucose-6-phosphate isomerase